MKLKIGDRIRDIEDGDCYFEGIITEIKGDEIKYKLEKIIWNGEEELENSDFGKVISPEWWKIEKATNYNEWKIK